MKQAADQLRIKGKENRHLIMELLDSNNSVEQHIYYQTNGVPEKIQSYSKKSLSNAKTVNGLKSGVSASKSNL